MVSPVRQSSPTASSPLSSRSSMSFQKGSCMSNPEFSAKAYSTANESSAERCTPFLATPLLAFARSNVAKVRGGGKFKCTISRNNSSILNSRCRCMKFISDRILGVSNGVHIRALK